MYMLLTTKMPQIRLAELEVCCLNTKIGDNKALYFLYSEFLMRANRNADYGKILNDGEILAIDGRAVQWLWNFEKQPSLGIAKILNFLRNGILMFVDFVLKRNYETKNDLILGRKFVYNTFEIAQKNDQKIVIVCASDGDILRENLTKMYPKLNFEICSFDPNGDFMSEKMYSSLSILQKHSLMTAKNMPKEFVQAFEIAKDFVQKEAPELVLVCLGGSSGKQEFFIDYLKKSEAKFGIAMSLGAALDHLGAGQKQQKIPETIQNLGLEFLYRLYKNPKRFERIWDSTINFLWKCS